MDVPSQVLLVARRHRRETRQRNAVYDGPDGTGDAVPSRCFAWKTYRKPMGKPSLNSLNIMKHMGINGETWCLMMVDDLWWLMNGDGCWWCFPMRNGWRKWWSMLIVVFYDDLMLNDGLWWLVDGWLMSSFSPVGVRDSCCLMTFI